MKQERERSEGEHEIKDAEVDASVDQAGVENAVGVKVARRVYVGNLAWRTSWQDLKDHFGVVGEVRFADVLRSGMRSKGCGIVEYESASAAKAAIESLNHSMLDGRQVIVREDREEGSMRQSSYVKRGDGAASFQKSMGRESCQIVVHGLPYKMSWQDLKDLVRDVARAPVIRADIMTTVDGLSKGYGVVVLSNQEDAQTVISYLHGRVVDGRVLTAKFDKFTRK